jgi:hypothetical protein
MFAWTGNALGCVDPGVELGAYLQVLEEAGIAPAAGRD